MFRSKHRSVSVKKEELGMINNGVSIAIDNHESTPLRQATTSEARVSSRSTQLARRSASDTLSSPSISRSRSWFRSGIVIKILSVILFLSWPTFVLAFLFVRTTTTPLIVDTKTTKSPPLSSASASVNLRGNKEKTPSAAKFDFSKNGGFASKNGIRDNRAPMNLSLWLIPSRGEKGKKGESETNNNAESKDKKVTNSVYERTQTVIDNLATELGGPKFMPHVTLGGTTVASDAEALELAEKLRTGLSGYGPVNCFIGDEVLSEHTWNQALVFELIPPFDDFMGICAASRKILGEKATKFDKEDCLSFPPPLRVPHMSLYYGISPPPPSETYLSGVFGIRNGEEKRTFQADRVMLWKTDPSSLEGVSEWEPIVDISLI